MECSNDTTQKRKPQQQQQTVVRSVDDAATCTTPTLLTLPMADFRPPTEEKKNELVLLQLPPKSLFTVSDLMNGSACIIGPTKKKHHDDDDDDEGEGHATSNRRKTDQACLVVESKGCTYELSRVETSNALVLVPPLLSQSSGGADEPETKKQKLSTDISTKTSTDLSSSSSKLVEMSARALGCNGSVASFLEAKHRLFDKPRLRKILSKYVYDPYSKKQKNPYINHKDDQSSSSVPWGLTRKELAIQMQCSQKELESAFKNIDVFCLQKDGDDDDDTEKVSTKRYGTLSEEVKYDALTAVVAALAECEKFENYGTDDLIKSEFVAEVMSRGNGGEGGGKGEDELEECVVKHCIQTCIVREEDKKSDDRVRVDVAKIAIFLAHHLFNSQTQPWERSAFLSEWQRLIPGVGNIYEPKLEWLRGVCIEVKGATESQMPDQNSGGDNNDTVFLKYLPENKLSMDPSKRFQYLFTEREKWSLQELEPYISKLAEEVGITQAELLMKFGRVVTDDDGNQMYMAR